MREEVSRVVAGDEAQKLFKNGSLLFLCVRPIGMLCLIRAFTDDNADQVDIPLVWNSFDIEVYPNVCSGKGRCPENVHPSIAQSQGVECMIPRRTPPTGTFSPSARPKRVMELANR